MTDTVSPDHRSRVRFPTADVTRRDMSVRPAVRADEVRFETARSIIALHGETSKLRRLHGLGLNGRESVTAPRFLPQLGDGADDLGLHLVQLCAPVWPAVRAVWWEAERRVLAACAGVGVLEGDVAVLGQALEGGCGQVAAAKVAGGAVAGVDVDAGAVRGVRQLSLPAHHRIARGADCRKLQNSRACRPARVEPANAGMRANRAEHSPDWDPR